MSIRQVQPANNASEPFAPAGFQSPMMCEDGDSALHAPVALGEGAGFNTAAPQQPLTRKVTTSIKATLSELANSRAKGQWAPSPEALKSIFRQRQFMDLSGQQEDRGDLKNTVLHEVSCNKVQSTFPLALGVDITGVDANTYAQSGSSYSTIVLPLATFAEHAVLQKDDPQVAYDFMARYPGYTAANLETNGVHAVPAKRFVLVSQEHPLMTAIKDNEAALQASEFAVMQEGLVKMSHSLYQAVMPVVKQQVEAQVKVRDYSKASVSIAPAEYASWQCALEAVTADAVRPFKDLRRRELAAASNADAKAAINSKYDMDEHRAMHMAQHTPLEFHMELEHQYNFMSH